MNYPPGKLMKLCFRYNMQREKHNMLQTRLQTDRYSSQVSRTRLLSTKLPHELREESEKFLGMIPYKAK